MPVSCNFGIAALKRAQLHGQGWHQLFDTTKMTREHLRGVLSRMREMGYWYVSFFQVNEDVKINAWSSLSASSTWRNHMKLCCWPSVWRPVSKPAKAGAGEALGQKASSNTLFGGF